MDLQRLVKMKWSWFLLICLAIQAECATTDFTRRQGHHKIKYNDSSDALASVREYPSELHRCNAAFIKVDILVTTATCIFCYPQCNLFVHVLSEHLIGPGPEDGKSIDIQSSAIHPDFEEYPQTNDLGLLQLKAEVKGAQIFHLPTSVPTRETSATLYKWEFSKDRKDYYLHMRKVTAITNAICSILLYQYIDCQYICAHSTDSIVMGSFDQGAPMVLEIHQKHFIVGLYTRQGLLKSSTVEVFQLISPFVDWIKSVNFSNQTKPSKGSSQQTAAQRPKPGKKPTKKPPKGAIKPTTEHTKGLGRPLNWGDGAQKSLDDEFDDDSYED